MRVFQAFAPSLSSLNHRPLEFKHQQEREISAEMKRWIALHQH